jgi:predicted small lipoprotein YifL
MQLLSVRDSGCSFGDFLNRGSAAIANAMIAIATVVLLAACGSKEAQPVAPSMPQVQKEKTPDDPTARMARAVTIGQSNVPVELKYEILNKPIVGTPVEIELAVIPTFGADSLSIAFAGSSGLTLSADSAPNVDKVKVKQVERVKLSAQAHEATVFYITVTATLYNAGTSSARVFALPIIMSSASPAAAATPAPAAAPVKKT